jgi:NADPH2:quinone reductase
MRAVVIPKFGAPEVLRIEERPIPVPGPGEVLIKVEAIGVCRPDSLQRRGMHPAPAGVVQDVPGLEVAGTIVSTGKSVCALLPGGGYADYALAPHQQVLPIPQNWSAQDAATLPENMFTAWDNLFRRAHLTGGETLLVHGGTSGLGSTAIMLGLAFGAKVIATAGSEAKCAACLKIGASHAINYRTTDFVPAVMEHTGGRGADVVMDIVGRDYIQRSLECLAKEGRLVHLATQGPDKLATIDSGTLIRRHATVIASTLRHRTPDQKGEIAAGLLSHVWPKLPARSPIFPLIDSLHPLADVVKVHEYFDSGAHIGKIVLIP